MKLYKNIVISLLLLVFVCASNAQNCAITNHIAENEKHLILILHGNNYQLLRTATVPNGSSLILICNASIQRSVSCRNGVFQPALPLATTCPRTPRAILRPGRDSDCIAPAETHDVGFLFNNDFYKLYHSCYDKTASRAIFTKHTIYYNNVVVNRPDRDFTLDGVITRARANTFNNADIFDLFNRLFGTTQQYIPDAKSNYIDRGHLAGDGDFFFLSNKYASYKYLNVIPQFTRLNRGSWSQLEMAVRNLLSPGQPEAAITTGAFGTAAMRHQGSFIDLVLGGNFNPVPRWVYKIVKQNGIPIYALVQYNNIVGRVPAAPRGCTPISPCLSNDPTVYCCNPLTFRPV